MNSIRVIPKGLLGVEILLQKEMRLEVWLLKIRRYKLAVLRISLFDMSMHYVIL